MLDSATLLQAGALLPLGVSAADADTVAAHTYSHPALSFAVVRLTAEALQAGGDAEMAALGFAKQNRTAALGQIRRRAPGFPGWALVNDPPNARYALAVVQELKKAARRMVTKPGHAKDDLMAIGLKLSRTTPHFLPSYWEEAARQFSAAGNQTYAAQCFEKAREAERQYGLRVDEKARADAFLEFALAGALAAKSLSAYAKSLLESSDKLNAYEAFLSLCVKRTHGGIAPWAGMAKDLRSLAKAAKLNTEAEELRLIAQILPAPATARAPAEVWKSWKAPLAALAQQDPKVAHRLLDLWPEPEGSEPDGEFQQMWLQLLQNCAGAEWLLASPPGKPAAWLARLLRWGAESPALACAWLNTLAPRLLADAVPLPVEPGEDEWSLDLDAVFAEQALALGVAFGGSNDHLSLTLTNWAKAGAAAIDLPLLAGDLRFGQLLIDAVDGSIGDEEFETAARGKPALRAAREAWLHQHLAALTEGALHACEEALETLEEKTSPALFVEFPQALAQLQEVSVAPLLQNLLRDGVFDELGWPALEQTVGKLRGAGKNAAEVEASGAWPWLVLHTDKKAVVLGADGPVYEHDLKVPKGARLFGMRYAGGQLLVVYRDSSYDGKGYWSGQAGKVLDVDDPYDFRGFGKPGVSLPDGAVCDGGKALRPGALPSGDRSEFLSDGQLFWRWDDGERGDAPAGQPGWRLLDPATGEMGAAQVPPWLAVELPAGQRWGDESDQLLLPAPAGMTASPLGIHNGLIGMRVWQTIPPRTGPDPDDEASVEHMVAEGIDGRRCEGFVDREVPAALLRYPGSDQVLAVLGDDAGAIWRGCGDRSVLLQTVDEDDDTRPAGTALVPPVLFWHYFQARDLKGSQALRELDLPTAQALLDAGLAVAGTFRPGDLDEKLKLPAELVAKALPDVTHPGLQVGIAQQVARAVDLQVRLGKLASTAGDDTLDDPNPFDDSAIVEAMGSAFLERTYGYGELSQCLTAAHKYLTTLPSAGCHALPESDLPWPDWVGREDALVALACSVGVAHREDAKGHLLQLLRRLADFPWSSQPERFERQRLSIAAEDSPLVQLGEFDEEDYGNGEPKPVAPWWVYSDGERGWLMQRSSDDTDRPVEVAAIAWALKGPPQLPEGAAVIERKPLAAAPWRDRLLAGIALAADNDFSVLQPGVAELIADKTGLSRAGAAWLWAGLPQTSRYNADFLGKPLREALGVKTAEAKVAKTSLQDLQSQHLWTLFAAALPEDPQGLLQPLAGGDHSPALRFALAYQQTQGARLVLPPELLIDVEKRVNPDMDTRDLLTALAAPGQPSAFHRDAAWAMMASGDVDHLDKVEDPFELSAASSLAKLVPYVAAMLPAGDPLRAGLKPLFELALQRLANPNLLIGLDSWYGDERGKKKRQAWFDSLGGQPFAPQCYQTDSDETKAHLPEARDTGLLVATLDSEAYASAAWRPAQIKDERDWKLLQDIKVLFNGEGDGSLDADLFAVRFLLSDGCAQLVARATDCPLAAGASEFNPRLSAPEQVAAAQKTLALTEDAAVLYLQLLALAAPTQRDVLLWNGWKAAQYKKAAEELVDRGLVVAGKRPRAGREQFLPGGWEELPSPDVPLESWKIAMYGLVRKTNGKLQAPLGWAAPLQPVHLLFAQAWQRVASGDVPALEQARVTKGKI